MDTERIVLLVMAGVLSVIAWLMVQPFLAYVLFAVLLGFVLQPAQRRLAPRIGSNISAFLLMIAAIVVAVVPLALATAAVIQDAQDLTADVNQTQVVDIDNLEDYIREYTGQSLDLEQTFNSAVNQFTETTFGSFSRFVNLVASIAIGLTLMMFLLFYFIRDGPEMVEWAGETLPLSDEVEKSLYDRIDTTTWAVIKGHVLVAVAQGLIAGIGLFIAGVPNYIFWTFLMVLLGFVPIVGTLLVWGPAAIYLFLIDRPTAGIFLLVYGFVVVGMTDNVLRPLFVDRRAELHPGVIIIGVIGGVYLFGAPGIFFGPILLGVFKSVLSVISNNR